MAPYPDQDEAGDARHRIEQQLDGARATRHPLRGRRHLRQPVERSIEDVVRLERDPAWSPHAQGVRGSKRW
jgi:hypothetical protein